MQKPDMYEGAVIRVSRQRVENSPIDLSEGAEFDTIDTSEVVEKHKGVEKFARYRARIDEVDDEHVTYTLIRRLR